MSTRHYKRSVDKDYIVPQPCYYNTDDVLLISKAGEVRSETYWRKWVDKAYKDVGKCQYSKKDRKEKKDTKPGDAWDRMVKILGLRPYNGEYEHD